MASKNPRPPEKSLTALSLFRFTFFFHLAVIMVGAALMALQWGADGEFVLGINIFHDALNMVLLLVGLAIVILYVTFFYGSLFSMVKGIRDGIYSNMFDGLSGVGPFSAINYVTGVLVILGALVVIIGVAPIDILPFEVLPAYVECICANVYVYPAEYANEYAELAENINGFDIECAYHQLPGYARAIYRWFSDSATIALLTMALGVILSRAGSLVCTNVVNKFNRGLGEEE